MTNTCELACEVLRATHDGDDRAPPDLKLIELAVNGLLNERGKALFLELHRNATKPEVTPDPGFLGSNTLLATISGYWKGGRVEHFDHDLWQEAGWQERMKTAAESLAARGRNLESLGIVPDMRNVLESTM